MIREETFQLAGLTTTEAKVMSVMIRIGLAGPSEIASEAGLFRPQVYDALERLKQKNFVSYVVKNKRRVYSISDTKAITELLKKKQEEISKAIPEVMRAFAGAEKENITILTGVKGIKTMLNTTMETMKAGPKRNIYRVMLSDASPIQLLGNWLRRWHLKRAELGLNAMLIFTADAAWRGKQLEKHAATQIRYIKGMQKIPVGLHSCGKYAWVIFWGKEAPFSIQIEDEKVARAFDEYFELMWAAAETKATG